MSLRSLALFRLTYFPGLLVAVVVAGTMMGAAVAAGPLFLASAGSSSLERFIDQAGDDASTAFAVVSTGLMSEDLIEYRNEVLDEAARGIAAPPIRTIVGEVVNAGRPGEASSPVRLIHRSQALVHVDIAEDAGGDGVWIADYSANLMNAEAGDTLVLSGARGDVEVRVAGIYEDLLAKPYPPFWRPLFPLIYRPPMSDTRPPPLVLADRSLFLELALGLGDERSEFRWEFPLLTDRMPLEGARELSDDINRLGLALQDSNTKLGGAFEESNFGPVLPAWSTRAAATEAGISGPITSLAMAARLVALIAVVATGVFAIRRRRVEFTLLHSRGVAPTRLGAGAALEALLPLAVGVAGGWIGGVALIRTAGPGGLITDRALTSSALDAVVLFGIGLALYALAAAWVVRAGAAEEPARGIRTVARIPWEALVLVAAGAALYEVLNGGAKASLSADGIREIDRLVFLFPLLFVAGIAGLSSRYAGSTLGKLRGLTSNRGASLYLAVRRLAAMSRSASVLMTASTVAIGMLIFASVLSASAGAGAYRTASLVIGSEAAATFSGASPDLTRLDLPATEVVRLPEAPIEPELTEAVDILGIDPATFKRAAYWDRTFAEESLEVLLERLGEGPASQALPAILVGSPVPEGGELLLTTYDIAARVVAQTSTWPGRVGSNPTLIVNKASLAGALVEAGTRLERIAGSREIWTTAGLNDLSAALENQQISVIETRSTEQLTEAPSFLALTWMFGFLEVVGIATGSLVLLSMCLFLVARQRRGEAAYAITSRMGLSRRTHVVSIAMELGGMLAISLVVGALAGGIAAWVMHSRIEVGSTEAAGALFRVPLTTLALLVSVLVVFVLAGAWLVQRRANRTDFGQVMRYAD